MVRVRAQGEIAPRSPAAHAICQRLRTRPDAICTSPPVGSVNRSAPPVLAVEPSLVVADGPVLAPDGSRQAQIVRPLACRSAGLPSE